MNHFLLYCLSNYRQVDRNLKIGNSPKLAEFYYGIIKMTVYTKSSKSSPSVMYKLQ